MNASRVSLGSSVIGSVVLGGGSVDTVVVEVVAGLFSLGSDSATVVWAVVVEAIAGIDDGSDDSPKVVVGAGLVVGSDSPNWALVAGTPGSSGASDVEPHPTKRTVANAATTICEQRLREDEKYTV